MKAGWIMVALPGASCVVFFLVGCLVRRHRDRRSR